MRKRTGGILLNRIRRLVILMTAVTVFAMPALFARASDTQTGTLEVQISSDAEGIGLTLYKVADYNNGSFVYTEEFAKSGVVISDLNNSTQAQEAAAALAEYADEQGIGSGAATGRKSRSAGNTVTTMAVGSSGTVSFDNLSSGLYLVAQTDGTEILETQPALVPVPYTSSDDGSAIYEVTIALKSTFAGGAVILTKTDDAGDVVAGAVFVLQQKIYVDSASDVPEGTESGTDDSGVYYWKEFAKDLTTSTYGQVVVTGLPTGDYRLVETKVPEGYVESDLVVTFTISRVGTVTETDGFYTADEGAVQELSAVNNRTQVEINKVDEAGEAVAGAKLVIKDSEGNVIHTEEGIAAYGMDTTAGRDILYGLPAGTYYLSEVAEPDGYKYTKDVKFTVSAVEGAENSVTMVDPSKTGETVQDTNTTAESEPTEGSVTVTKSLVLQDGVHAIAEDASFYVALFEDEACTVRVSGVKTITYSGTSAASVTFDGLDLDMTYYVAETDEYGEVLKRGTTSDDVIFIPVYPSDQSVTLTADSNTKEFAFENEFYALPSGYYYGGELTVTKKTVLDGEAFDTDDVFYARVFTDASCTTPVSEILELDMAGGSSCSRTVEVSVGESDGDSVTYYVMETDNLGNPITDSSSLTFTMTMDKTSVTMSAEQSTESVTITNTFASEEESEESGDTVTSGEDSSSDGTSETGTASGSVQTGDDTPAARMLVLLFAALGILLLTAGMRVRARRRG
ncbi:MAG: hypothetical protein LIO76_06675 [Clostridiales bacterium]|nr:hypothetical protein [Clostridiales bacterium]